MVISISPVFKVKKKNFYYIKYINLIKTISKMSLKWPQLGLNQMVCISTAQQLLRERQSRGISWVGKVAEIELLQMYERKCLHHKCALVSVLYLCSLMSRVSVVTMLDSRINKAILLSFTKAGEQILYPPCALNQIFSLHMLTATIEMKTQTHINNT